MARTVNVHEAKTHLSRLLAGVDRDGEIVIACGGKPVARLVPVRPFRTPRQPGSPKGQSLRVSSLPALHPDPLDRMLGAQAQVANVPILTADLQIARYPAEVVW